MSSFIGAGEALEDFYHKKHVFFADFAIDKISVNDFGIPVFLNTVSVKICDCSDIFHNFIFLFALPLQT